jgi:hypothetical protein
MSRSFLLRPRAGLALVLSAAVALALFASSAWAGPGYQLDSAKPSISLGAEVPVGVAIDQSSQVIYVAEASRSLFNIQPGQVEQLSSSGVPTASSPFGTGGQDFFVSVAVNPVTHGIYAYQIEGSTPQGQKGTSKVSVFSSAGAIGTSFAPVNAQAESLAADSTGRLYFPNNASGSVQIFSAAGSLESSITCGGCPGGSFVTPQSVALDSAGKIYVVDSANGGRVVKLSSTGAYESTLQSGAGAAAVAVDGASGDVFVGDLVGGKYHVVAYDSAGVAFDDFGAGLVSQSQINVITGQLAVNATTHKVYLSNPGGQNLWVFERVGSIPAPTATITPATPVGQVEATLRATVNPKGHVLTSCGFEYVDHADFLANAYANAETAPCPAVVGDKESVSVSANVKGLDTETSYDYRVKIASFGGSAESSDQSFQTLPPLPPEATAGAASVLTKTTATLGGTVNPKGGTVSNCHFEYVTETAFQSGAFTGATSKTCSTTPSGNFAASVSAKVTGLSAGTAYRFRVVATNNSGTTQATDKAFATLAETCAENPAVCPPPETPQTPSSPAQVEAGPVSTVPPPPQSKPLKCRKGFKKKRVRGKLKCVKVKKHRAKHRAKRS